MPFVGYDFQSKITYCIDLLLGATLTKYHKPGGLTTDT